MSELIQSKQDLIEYLTTKKVASKEPPKTVNVTTKLRRIVMTDEMQGKFIHKGTFKRFVFKSLGGGVYSAEIETKAT
jgi:hypothetical protein